MKIQYKKGLMLSLLIMGNVFSAFSTTHIVNVEDNEFNPANLTVNVGDTVMWMWDHGHHTTTSDAIPSGAISWDNPMDQNNVMFSYVIHVAGSYDYECIYHASMGMIGHIEALSITRIADISQTNSYSLSASVVSENVQMKFGEDHSLLNIELLSLKGSKLRSFTIEKNIATGIFPVYDFPQGIYILNVSDELKTKSFRIIKQ